MKVIPLWVWTIPLSLGVLAVLLGVYHDQAMSAAMGGFSVGMFACRIIYNAEIKRGIEGQL